MPKRRKGESRRNGGSPSRPKHQASNLKSVHDREREAMLCAGLLSMANLGINPLAQKAVIIVNSDDPEVVIHTPGQTVLGVESHFFLQPTDNGTVLVSFSPSSQKGDGLPGALLCARHFSNKPSPSQIRHFTTERWKFREDVDA